MEQPIHRGFGSAGVPYYGAEGEDYDYYESGDYDRDRREADGEAHYAMMEYEREKAEARRVARRRRRR